MTKPKETKFVRLPEKNKQEAQRLLNNLHRRLAEIKQQAEKIQLTSVRKGLKKKD